MTDNQIIIDTTRCAWKSLEGTLCPEAQEQLDQLKKQLEAYKMEAEEGKEINAELKAENEELKEIIQRHDNDNNALLSEFEDDLVEYYRRHRECLIEIKEIAEDQKDVLESMRIDIAEQILNKISEVLDESN